MFRKLKIKFVCIIMFIVTAMLFLMFFLLFSLTEKNLREQNIAMMDQVTKIGGPMDKPAPIPDMDIRMPYFCVHLDRNGNITRSEGSLSELSEESTLDALLEISLSNEDSTDILWEYSLRYLRRETHFGTCIVFADISGERDALGTFFRNCLIIGSISICVFLIISIYLSRWAVEPLINAWNQQKQFTADASHELKTPLTVIMANAQMLQSGEFSKDESRDLADGIVDMSQQMRGMVEQLLELARADEQKSLVSRENLNFSLIVQDAVMSFEPMMYEQALSVSSDIFPDIQISGSKQELTHLVEILLDNAAKYSFENTKVSVELKMLDKHMCQLMVENTGAVIPQEDLKKIFQRFYRADKARTMNHSYGLGLAIAEQTVFKYKGKIWAESCKERNRFFVKLPTL